MIRPSDWMDPDRYAESRHRYEQNERLRQALTREILRIQTSDALAHGTLYEQGYWAGVNQVLVKLVEAVHEKDATRRDDGPIPLHDEGASHGRSTPRV